MSCPLGKSRNDQGRGAGGRRHGHGPALPGSAARPPRLSTPLGLGILVSKREASALTLAPSDSGILLFLTWDLCLPDPWSPFRAGSGNLSVGSLSTGHLHCWSRHGTQPVTGPTTSPAEPARPGAPEPPAARRILRHTTNDRSFLAQGQQLPSKRFLLDSEQTAVLRLGFQAQRGAAPENGIFSSLSTISDLDFSASGCTPPTGLWLPSCRETAPHVCPWTALWARSPSGPWGEVSAEGTLTVKIFLPTCVSVWAQPQPFQNPQTCWCFQRTQTPGRL